MFVVICSSSNDEGSGSLVVTWTISSTISAMKIQVVILIFLKLSTMYWTETLIFF
jgi:hypothetical protein